MSIRNKFIVIHKGDNNCNRSGNKEIYQLKTKQVLPTKVKQNHNLQTTESYIIMFIIKHQVSTLRMLYLIHEDGRKIQLLQFFIFVLVYHTVNWLAVKVFKRKVRMFSVQSLIYVLTYDHTPPPEPLFA